jgi:hypothetical protein
MLESHESNEIHQSNTTESLNPQNTTFSKNSIKRMSTKFAIICDS